MHTPMSSFGVCAAPPPPPLNPCTDCAPEAHAPSSHCADLEGEWGGVASLLCLAMCHADEPPEP